MTNPMDFWVAWFRGWTAATHSLIEAQQQALQQLMNMPRQASAPTLDEMARAARGTTPAVQALARMSAEELAPRRRGRPPGPVRVAAEALEAAGNKPARRRGRPPKNAAGGAPRGRGRPRKSR